MNKEFMQVCKVLQITLLCLTILGIVSCSNGSINNNSNNGDVNQLQLITPKTIYSSPNSTNTGYIVINNPTSTTIKNLHYNLDNLIGGALGIQIDQFSATQCGTIEPHSQCNLKLTVPLGAVAGSFSLKLNNYNSLLSKTSQQLITQAIGIQQSAYNDLSGADGITLNYYHTVINGTAYILVSGLVASANAGNFNNVVLVDSNNNPIPNQQLIAGVGTYTQGKTFSILLPVPVGNNHTQIIKVQTQLITSSVKNSNKSLSSTEVVSTASISSTLSTVSNVGIVEMLPSAIYLNQNNPNQSVTFSNIGNVTAELKSFVASNPNIEVVFSAGTLTGGNTTTAILKLKDPTPSSLSGEIILTYYNGQREIATAAIANQNTDVDPSPTPIPGLTAVLNPDNDFFVTTTNSSTSRQLTLTNSGNTNENNFSLNLPTNFTLSDGTNPATKCTVIQPSTISNTLTAKGGNCTVTVTYTNSAPTSQSSGSISIAYTYNNGVVATPVQLGVNYQVTQSTANLSLSPSSMSYAAIQNNDASTSSAGSLFTISNSGEVAATNLGFNITGTNNNLFSVISGGSCVSGGILESSPATCTISTQFGPAANSVATGTKTADLNVSYLPYSGGTIQSTNTATLSSEVTQAPSATYTSEVTTNNFISGAGTQNDSYIGYTESSYTLGITYTNNSSVSATGFTTSYSPPVGWTLTTHGCNNVTMAATSGTCSDIYTLNSTDAGNYNLLLQNVTANWTDSSGTYINQSIDGTQVYASLVPKPIPLAIVISNIQGDQTSVMGTIPITFTATVSGGASTLSATLSNSVTGIIISDPSPCSLSADATTSCTFNIIPWYTGFDNSNVGIPDYDPYIASGTQILLSATNGATISGNGVTNNSISYSVSTPYIYLSAPQEGAATDTNTGITWGSGGSISNRFELGTQSNGQPCSDSVLDNLTGLEWAKNGIIGFKSTTYGSLIAQPNYTNTNINLNMIGNWSDVNAAINNMNIATIKLCGQSDWRLPTETELLSLVNYSAPDGNIAAWLINEGFSNIQSNNYWSITPVGSGLYVWAVYMADGTNSTLNKNNNVADGAYVWPVRSR